MASKVSFTVRRPTPVSRATSSGPESDVGSSFKVPQLPKHLNGNSAAPSPLARSHTSSPNPRGREAEENNQAYDSSDEESINEDELVTGFDRFGVQRANGEKKVQKPLVIPALKNKDWRELARKRRGASQYVPPSAAAQTGADGSVGGLGTKDTINSGPVLSGLQVKQRTLVKQEDDVTVQEVVEDVKMEVVEEETDDQKALRAILAEASGEVHSEGAMIDIIPTPISEAEALKQDVEELPDAATLEDYNRVPVSQFGAAMLRGMGWKEGTAATRKPGKGLVEPYIPAARPALLGIGAKEQEVYDDGSKKKGSGSKRPERRYVPIIKQERSETSSPAAGGRDKRERSRSPRRSAPSSRKPSPDRYNSRTERDGESRRRYDDHDRHRDSDRRRTDEPNRRDDYREKDRSERRDRDKDRRRDRDGDRERSDRRPDSYDSSRRKKDY